MPKKKWKMHQQEGDRRTMGKVGRRHENKEGNGKRWNSPIFHSNSFREEGRGGSNRQQ
jgi:hypothetical protein